MGVLVFNAQGLLATLGFGIPLLFLVDHFEKTGQIERGNGLALILIGTTLLSSLYGYTVDRCDRRGIIRPYWANWSQLCHQALGQNPPSGFRYNPYRRTAVFLWPLALGPFFLLALLVGFWLYARWKDGQFFRGGLLPRLIVYSVVSCTIAAIYAGATQGRRLIEGEPQL